MGLPHVVSPGPTRFVCLSLNTHFAETGPGSAAQLAGYWEVFSPGPLTQPTNVEPVTSLAVNMDQLSTTALQASTATPPVPNPHGGFDAHAPSAGGQGDTGATASSMEAGRVMDEPPSDLNATEATR